MKAEDVDFVIVPGWTDSGPDHWQTRWETRLKTARRAPIPDYDKPERDAWVRAIVASANAASRPVFCVAHSLGCIAVAHAADALKGRVVGAMLVAAPDLGAPEVVDAFLAEAGEGVERPRGFDPTPLAALPFPSLLVASRNDPFCAFSRAEALADAWGSTLVDAGEAGHIHTAAGYGPWPEGAMRLGAFLKSL
ncbi:MAG: alpha/beta hydrolase [Parvularculaceae bacterium]|nr:alpha/beta hydrolase [Parvularculaceae bacterium]